MKILIIGKDCGENDAALMSYLDSLGDSKRQHMYVVGVHKFKCTLDLHKLPSRYYPRQKGQRENALRLGNLFSGVEQVVALPVRGLMTTIEYAWAKEFGVPIINVQSHRD